MWIVEEKEEEVEVEEKRDTSGDDDDDVDVDAAMRKAALAALWSVLLRFQHSLIKEHITTTAQNVFSLVENC